MNKITVTDTNKELSKRRKEVNISSTWYSYTEWGLKEIRAFGKIQQDKINSLISIPNDNGYKKLQ